MEQQKSWVKKNLGTEIWKSVEISLNLLNSAWQKIAKYLAEQLFMLDFCDGSLYPARIISHVG
ncbi:MAG: hypothetical protein H7839_16780, partial [Magnetococcus sp. YQC-5]